MLVFTAMTLACGTPADTTDASVDSGAAEATTSDAATGCNSTCDCPHGMLCTIDHVCYGDPSVAPCEQGTCPCGQTCTDGFCPPFVGSLKACTTSCDCGIETCVAGRCVKAQSAGGSCESNADCTKCSGTICLMPGGPAFCGKAGQCQRQIHCLLYGKPGTTCDCLTDPEHSFECPGGAFGDCVPIAGTPHIAAQAFTPPMKPSGLCFGNQGELATVDVSGASSPSVITFYAEGTGSSPQDAQYMFELFAPGSPKPIFFDALALGEPVPQFSRVFPLGTIPATVNGTWTLCAYMNLSGGSMTIDRWGLFVQ
jgi:hypothetical protein